ncbi:MAG: hypothetical protein V4445_07330 [Pseudomonadota bacterium]
MILCVEPPRVSGNACEVKVNIELSDSSQSVMLYRFPVYQIPRLTQWSDPYLIAVIFLAMFRNEDVLVKGIVSPSLLENLERFQDIWSCWRPGIYNKVNILATSEEEEPDVVGRDASALYSGGIDAAFALLKHARADLGRQGRDIKFALMTCGMGGFQNGAEQHFHTALTEASGAILPLGVRLGWVATNWQNVMLRHGLNIYDIFPSGFISCLHLFRRGITAGVFGSSDNTQHYKWAVAGSNPLTDRLFSSRGFQMLHEGSGFSRIEKIRYLANWPDYFKAMRVCNQSDREHRNCGVCEKCFRTALALHVAGVKLPEGFSLPNANQISAIKINSPEVLESIQALLSEARLVGFGHEVWFKQLSAQAERFS